MTQTINEPLVILGTSMFAPEVLDLANDTGRFSVDAFIENWDRDKAGSEILGKPVIWIDDAADLAETHLAICSLGTTRRRTFVRAAEDMGFAYATLCHPGAHVSSMSSVDTGSLVSVGTIVASNTCIGRHVILNRGVLVGHDTEIHDYVTVSPGANIAGAVSIGEGAYIGMGAIVLDRVAIGEGALVGAGSVVTRDVPDRSQVMGVPARIVKDNIEPR